MEIEKGTFGNIDEYKVLFILNEEADKDKRIRKILTNFNNSVKDITESQLKNKNYIFKLLYEDYKIKVSKINFENSIKSRLDNFFVSKIRSFNKKISNG